MVSIHGPPNIRKNWGTKCFHMFGDSVYAYHDFATRKNDGSCPLPCHGLRHCNLALYLYMLYENRLCSCTKLTMIAFKVFNFFMNGLDMHIEVTLSSTNKFTKMTLKIQYFFHELTDLCAF